MKENREEYWSKVISEQEASGQPARTFCRERKLGEHSFYQWRRRLKQPPSLQNDPVQFALLEAKAPGIKTAIATTTAAAPELLLPGGERLRIGNHVQAATLRLVLEVMCGG